jgi:D-glycero-alpha-D-manno-heptose 1-phosphate guanylyltransferase
LEAIILAGGFGTRLQSVVKNLPKPMADINNKPFLDYILDYLLKYEITDVVLSVGYKQEVIKEKYKESYKSINIKYASEDEPLGTGGAIKNALQYIEGEHVVVLNGDTFFDIDLKEFIEQHIFTKTDATLALKKMYKFDRYGRVDIEGNYVKGFIEKDFCEEGLINGGIYILKKEIFDKYSFSKNFSFENDILEKKVSSINIGAYVSDGFFIDIGIPEDYARAKLYLLPQKAVFLDRDGVINKDKKYVYKKEDFEFNEHIFELCEYFKNNNYLIFVITNQAGIARGYYTEEDFLELSKWMTDEFKKSNIIVSDVLYCPHHPEFGNDKYKTNCSCRKPEPGMILKIKNRYNIDLSESILIGDKESDVKAGEKAGISNNILLKSNYQKRFNFESIESYLHYKKDEK